MWSAAEFGVRREGLKERWRSAVRPPASPGWSSLHYSLRFYLSAASLRVTVASAPELNVFNECLALCLHNIDHRV